MNRISKFVLAFALLGFSLASPAGDEEICLDCHEPAEDWEGMTAEEVYTNAADLSIKRHADNADFSEEELRAVVAKLLEK